MKKNIPETGASDFINRQIDSLGFIYFFPLCQNGP